jgi:hydrophobic/amphiphilic exporter-1 (mainly G- bacteria), HAE1 family
MIHSLPTWLGGEPTNHPEQFTYFVRSDGRLVTEEQFGNIVLRAAEKDQIVRLKDVARVELGGGCFFPFRGVRAPFQLSGRPAE